MNPSRVGIALDFRKRGQSPFCENGQPNKKVTVFFCGNAVEEL